MAMALRAAYLSMHRQTNAHVAKHGITADQFVCLVLLDEEDGITQNELVRRATSDPNTIRAMLVLLEKQGLVARDPHPTDGRARHVTMTDKGRKVFEILLKAIKPVQEKLHSPFSREEASRIVQELRTIEDIMTE
jgi:DNA-binding MarR family transcriptional regulator